MPGVLSGTTVVDLSWGLPGAVLGMLLADNGARVIRVELPQSAGRPFRTPSRRAGRETGFFANS